MDAELLRGLVETAFRNSTVARGQGSEYQDECAFNAAWKDLREALAALSVAQGQGFVMVPRVPTEAMIEAGARYGVDGDFDTDLSNGVKDMSRRLAAGAYTAMLAAAHAQPDGVE